MPKHSLTRKQERFVAEYLVDLNATQAAIRAGYSKQNAGKIGPELLGKTRTLIETAAQRNVGKRLMAAEEVVARLQQIADADIADFMSWDPERRTVTLKSPQDIPKELRRCIKSITQHETKDVRYLKLELHSPVAALDKLAKYHNLFKRTVASKGLIVNILRPPLQPPSTTIPSSPMQNRPQLPQLEVTFKRPPGVVSLPGQEQLMKK
jgi:phage terminase small subunit